MIRTHNRRTMVALVAMMVCALQSSSTIAFPSTPLFSPRQTFAIARRTTAIPIGAAPSHQQRMFSLSVGTLFEDPSLLTGSILADASIGPTTLLTNTDFLVFVAGIFPFLWATYEFWRRIMFGEAFGTGTDSVIIGMDDAPSDSRGRRVLGKGALVTAYILFVCAFGTLAVVGYSVTTSAPPSSDDLAAALSVVSDSVPSE